MWKSSYVFLTIIPCTNNIWSTRFNCFFSRHVLKITSICPVHIIALWKLLNSLFFGIPVLSHTIAIESCPSMQINCKVCAIAFSPARIYPLGAYFSSSFQIRKLKMLSYSSAAQFQCQHSNIFFQKQKGKGKMKKRKRRNAACYQIRFCQMTNSKTGFNSLLKQ